MLLLSLLIIFCGIPLAAFTAGRRGLGWLPALIPLCAFTLLLNQATGIIEGVPLKEHYEWVQGLNFHLDLYLDGLSLLYALLITGIGTLVTGYAGSYLANDRHLPRFHVFLFIFMGSMLGVALSDNVFSLFVFWELTSLSSYLMIGYNHGDSGARRSALQALLVTGLGGLALMGGLILAATTTGTPLISEWRTALHDHPEFTQFGLMTTLILIGAFTKSAQFPFHFWLPNAMAAPTPVSAYLHSATMVKAGVYLLARLEFCFAGNDMWHFILMFTGGITMLTGAFYAYIQSDLKRILAYTTVSALGLLVFSLGIGTPVAIHGAVVFLFAHALYKGALFLIAGNIIHGTGKSDARLLHGLWKKMPVTGLTVIPATLSMAGFPLLTGFLAKELLYDASVAKGIFPVAVLFVTSALFASASILFGYKMFFGKMKTSLPINYHEVSPGMYTGPIILGLVGVITGVAPEVTIGPLLASASAAIREGMVPAPLHIWHGFNLVLALSLATLASGWGLYLFSAKAHELKSKLQHFEIAGPENLHDLLWKTLLRLGENITAVVQSGYMRYYIMTILLTLFGLAILTTIHYELHTFNSSLTGVDLYEILLAILVVASLIFVIRSGSRLAAIAILGVAGYGVAVFYSMYGAIDLAITQFLIETITVVVFVYVIYKLPGYMKLSAKIYHIRDSLIAIAGGVTMTAIILLVTNYPLASELKTFYAGNSYLLANGRNVVNVILVDFRAMDTMGEVVVLFIAAIGVMALSKLRIKKKTDKKHSS